MWQYTLRSDSVIFCLHSPDKAKTISLFNNQFNCLYLLMQLISISVASSSLHHLQRSGSKCNVHLSWGHSLKLGRGTASCFLVLLHFTSRSLLFLGLFFILNGLVCFHWLLIVLVHYSQSFHNSPIQASTKVLVNIILCGIYQNQASREPGNRLKFLWHMPLYQGRRTICKLGHMKHLEYSIIPQGKCKLNSNR